MRSLSSTATQLLVSLALELAALALHGSGHYLAAILFGIVGAVMFVDTVLPRSHRGRARRPARRRR